MERNRLLRCAALWTIIWFVGSVYWLAADKLIRDGDEEGHVGAAELFRQVLHEHGFVAWGLDAWQGSYGDYPPLYAAVLGAWWSLFEGAPSDVIIRLFGLLAVWLCAVALAHVVHKQGGSWFSAYMLVLCSPLLNGIGRHFMIEIFVILFTSILLASIYYAREKPTIGRALMIGIVAGLGVLSKQTFVIAVVPLLYLLLSLGRMNVFVLVGFMVLGGPWYIDHLLKPEQQSYLLQSIEPNTSSSFFFHFLDPLFQFGGVVLGPWILILLIVSCFHKPMKFELVWLVMGLGLFMLLPKKYPRLMLGLLPPAIIIISHYCSRFSLLRQHLVLLPVACWLWVGSSYELGIFRMKSLVDDGCPQIWLRPYDERDFGMHEIFLRLKPLPLGKVVVANSPNIPCTIQTTFDWFQHLPAYLRRRGLEHDILRSKPGDQEWKEARMRISWEGPIERYPHTLRIESSSGQ